jgi:hypothetical protein
MLRLAARAPASEAFCLGSGALTKSKLLGLSGTRSTFFVLHFHLPPLPRRGAVLSRREAALCRERARQSRINLENFASLSADDDKVLDREAHENSEMREKGRLCFRAFRPFRAVRGPHFNTPLLRYAARGLTLPAARPLLALLRPHNRANNQADHGSQHSPEDRTPICARAVRDSYSQ